MLYEYSAVDRTGKRTEGEEDAENERELALKLRAKNILLIESWEKGTKKRRFFDFSGIWSRVQRVSLMEKINFARNLAVMVGAGLSLTKSLDAMANQTENFKFKKMIIAMLEDVNRGKSFAESLSDYRRVFGDIFVNMIAAAEVSGKLEKTLVLLAKQMKRDYNIKSRVRGAMIYPVIIIIVMLAIGILMLIYVVPTLTATFSELKIDLPLTTRIVIGASQFLFSYYLYIIAGFLILAVGFYRGMKTKLGKEIFDRIILRMPVFGKLVKKFNIARFTRTMGSLITAGVAITKSLEITSSVLGNALYRQAVTEASLEIQKGKPINTVLKRYPNLFPAMVIQTIEVGEETGTISRMLFRLSLFFEEEVSNTTKNLSTIIEPMLMIAIGTVVGFFAVAMMQPIYGGLGGV